jgi:hypothetical protein
MHPAAVSATIKIGTRRLDRMRRIRTQLNTVNGLQPHMVKKA